MKWTEALKIWNDGKGIWCIPKKGTDAYAEVMNIVNGIIPVKKDSCECKKKEPKAIKEKPPLTAR